jgi:hypothetical protein
MACHFRDNPEHIFLVEEVDKLDDVLSGIETRYGCAPLSISHRFPVVCGESSEESVKVFVLEELAEPFDLFFGHLVEDILLEVRWTPCDKGCSPLGRGERFPVLIVETLVVLFVEILPEIRENADDLLSGAFIKNVLFEVLA